MAAPMALAGLALTDSGRPVLLEGEVERVMQDKARRRIGQAGVAATA